MDELDTREWLLTNGLGSFASGTVCDAHTRTYHGWLVAALEPPGQRTLLLSHIDASLTVAGREFELGTNFWAGGAIAPAGYHFLQSFQAAPVPTWIWGQNHWRVCRRLIMPHGLVASPLPPFNAQFDNRILIHYCYEGDKTATLRLRPLIGDRIFHTQQRADSGVHFAQLIESHRLLLQAKRLDWRGTSWQLSWTKGDYYSDDAWYWGYRYPEETRRGLADQEDLYCPGNLMVSLEPGESITLEAYIRPNHETSHETLQEHTFEQAIQTEQQRLTTAFAAIQNTSCGSQNERSTELWQRLLQAGDRFVVYRASTQNPTVIAGYPWFNDWGRDTLIALPGLALTPRRFDLAKGLLRTFGQHCQEGLIPNAFPDAGAKPFYNSLDASLWWIETLGLYLDATEDWDFLAEQYPVVWRIYKRLMAGTLYSIRVDAFDGLVTWDAADLALTWMDAVVADKPVTPRRGKAVEINALWYSALRWAEQWATRLLQSDLVIDIEAPMLSNQARRFNDQAQQVQISLEKFWNPAEDYLYDAIAPDDIPDVSIRPNAVIALSLKHCGFPDSMGKRVLQTARDRLLTPYGLRSLDPADPHYIGRYAGGIWQRDRAYHQGTVWPWLLGAFIRAWQRFYPTEPLPIDWQPLLNHFQNQGCLDSISEMFDGDPPHLPQGAIAQAWSVAELLRHCDALCELL
ncbi:MAG: amylo-alpha-1,6-glucosidase [Drouetiella hepatica Uher 2000/2452]|jgi:4-alpha-glucanotransferase|uniref:Amylo-alpha-1,6-glucosidase n=1 Tax=Drouetiella hepatica Uher 2000/2452 TaxID=904376 RepID=A0A951QAX3_9CYAN|nr:amylo-alpha-1,6-glucosidase [Drouetiella hepatica Uher 2000/2452]